MQGKRDFKYEFLSQNLSDLKWLNLDCLAPNYFFVPKNFDDLENYNIGFKINELFNVTSNGIEVGRESVGQSFSKNELNSIKTDLESLSSQEFQTKYQIKDSRDWVLELYKNDLLSSKKEITTLQVKPFDYRHTYFTGTSRGFHTYPAITVNKHVFKKTLRDASDTTTRSAAGETLFG